MLQKALTNNGENLVPTIGNWYKICLITSGRLIVEMNLWKEKKSIQVILLIASWLFLLYVSKYPRNISSQILQALIFIRRNVPGHAHGILSNKQKINVEP